MGTMFPDLVAAEIQRARNLHTTNIHNVAEGLSIIMEEFEEFKQEVFKKHRSQSDLLCELVQLAAMCQRTAEDCFLA